MNTVLRTVISDNPLTRLIGDVDQAFVGYVYSLKYDECFVQTNDAFKHAVNGLPHNSFLLAAGFDPARFDAASPIDQEVVLLRVLGPASLPQDADMVRTRIEHHQRRRDTERLPGDVNDGLDPMTASELQWGGMRCRVLGTFFMENGELRLGSDIENFMSLSRMRAFKPRGASLEMIVNHVNPEVRAKARDEALKAGFKDTPKPIDVGTVRFTSTARLHRGAGEPQVKVQIQPADFLARRTAVLGMTRTGKSNTVKTTVSAVAIAALKSGIKVGQLIFDVNGEYANANHQDDGSSIADVFGDSVKRYRAIDTPGFKDLRINFYEQPDVALGLLEQLSRDTRGSAQDITTFLTSSLDEPDQNGDRGEHNRWQVRRAAFCCVLNAARYRAPQDFTVDFPVSKAVLDAVKPKLPDDFPAPVVRGNNQQYLRLNLIQATVWFTAARATNLATPLPGSSKGSKWVDASLEATLNVLCNASSGGGYIRGYRQLQEYTDYHSWRRQGDVVKEILGFLYQGHIIILDLSAGPVSIRKTLSDRVARAVFDRQFDVLNRGDSPMNVVLYVEEAHNLIGKQAELTDTWPRIAKEGAKAKIAFVYATQEPSSVHANILANTENWFVTHLNNDDELRTLGKFYDFADFVGSLKAAQDVGFARIKTLSAPFVIPTQINRFTPEEIKRELAALAPGDSDSDKSRSGVEDLF
ncbi:MAG: DUF87 domain-containing protein [Denitratisoma sp.]|nr:DUF87 domain-containing protein [Denitratisoma sp.]